jgi:nucleoid-associated protein YgaU
MAAVLSPRFDLFDTGDHAASAGELSPGLAPWNDPTALPARPHLRLVEGGRSTRVAVARPGRHALRTVLGGLALAALVALAALGSVNLLGADAAASGPASTAESFHPAGADASTPSVPAVVVVQPGDTLWAIARRIQPTGDVRPLVDELAHRAGGAAVVSGQRVDITGLAD